MNSEKSINLFKMKKIYSLSDYLFHSYFFFNFFEFLLCKIYFLDVCNRDDIFQIFVTL